MFSVKVDKLTAMTDNEHNCYIVTARTVLEKCHDVYRTIAAVGDGTMAFKMAAVLQEKGKKVLFADADISEEIFLSKYRLGKNLKGITDYFLDDEMPENLICMTNREGLDIIFTGAVEDFESEDIDRTKFETLKNQYLNDYDYIIVQSGDCTEIAAMCDAAVLMLNRSDYSEMSAEVKVDSLDEQGCYVLGVIVSE